MENPFETLNQKLDRIIIMLDELLPGMVKSNSVSTKQVMTIMDGSNFLGISKQTLYGYTSKRTVPHYKNGKKLYFLHDELLAWLQTNQRKTITQITNDVSFHRTPYKAKKNYCS